MKTKPKLGKERKSQISDEDEILEEGIEGAKATSGLVKYH